MQAICAGCHRGKIVLVVIHNHTGLVNKARRGPHLEECSRQPWSHHRRLLPDFDAWILHVAAIPFTKRLFEQMRGICLEMCLQFVSPLKSIKKKKMVWSNAGGSDDVR